VADGVARQVLGFLKSSQAKYEAADDRELLRLFSTDGDHEAFSWLVRRHGALVLGVCRRHLGNSPDADDAFQATFIALSRQAAAVRETVPGWLYRVAVRICRKVRRKTPTTLSGPAPQNEPATGLDHVAWGELRRVLDEEIDRLPAEWRQPVVLCLVDGRTADDAARQLGWSRRTVFRRLAEARTALQARLTKRGLGLMGVALVATGADHLKADVSPALTATLLNNLTAPPAAVSRWIPRTFLGTLTMKCTTFLILVMAAGVGLIATGPTGPTPVSQLRAQGVPFAPKLPAAKPKDPLDPATRAAVDKAVEFLKSKAKVDGGWDGGFPIVQQGTNVLAILALLEAGVPLDDPVVTKGITLIRGMKLEQTYIVALMTQVLVKLKDPIDRDLIRKCVDWLERAANVGAGDVLLGWSYTDNPGGRGDGSNTRFAVVALYDAHKAGFPVKDESFWARLQAMYLREQGESGGWGYIAKGQPTITMTLSAQVGLRYCDAILTEESPAIAVALDRGSGWLVKNYKALNQAHPYYQHELLAVSCRSPGKRNDETRKLELQRYAETKKMLLADQKDDGSFRDSHEQMPFANAALAIRALCRPPND
jgi:RNA polymerase sigma factor (sigma-70 family)